ncbi:hypothetical protein H6F93_26525 [Leptolyngbya sp. FACHB-671]|uniref:hypothetical protein n=1 Tax=Leptolyngbya sp. FACHB-671 TaxID=2692812 RepID=UPI001688D6BF|nr:hypothetical protein [Leptolyngbya sp. FACHB-671]MBD1870208.1 hypothetical protein [Cyanobacteria bacterium FACHB-471]MBD2071029.1 hypothetical protein [Leptolyngbya sp. FACHB-671]
MRQIIVVCLTLVLLVLVSACSPALNSDAVDPETAPLEADVPSPTATTTSPNPVTVLPAALTERLKSFLAAETAITSEAIALQQFEPVDWNNACIGVPSPEEFCAEMITPGYRIVFNTPNGAYVVHTDHSGQTIRLAESPSD